MRTSIWSKVEDELEALIIAPSDIDDVPVETTQGVARRALNHIRELKAIIDETAVESKGLHQLQIDPKELI